MKSLHRCFFILLSASSVSAAFVASLSSALQSLSSASSATSSGINFSSGVYTVLILPKSSTRISSTSTTSSSTRSSSSSSLTSTVTPTTTVTPTPVPTTTTMTPTTTISSSSSTQTTTMTPTVTVTPTSSVCPISYATISVFPSSYCATYVMCQAAVSGCPVYNTSFMSQLSSLASSSSSSTSSSSPNSTLTVTSTSTSTSTMTGVVISSVSTGVSSSAGQTIVTSGAIVIEINNDGSTSTVFAGSARKYRANSTNNSGAFTNKTGMITLSITLMTAFLLGMITI